MRTFIFEGADTRKAAQFSEVALLLTSASSSSAANFHEIEIMRARVPRDGQGKLFLSTASLPPEDIHKLFNAHTQA